MSVDLDFLQVLASCDNCCWCEIVIVGGGGVNVPEFNQELKSSQTCFKVQSSHFPYMYNEPKKTPRSVVTVDG